MPSHHRAQIAEAVRAVRIVSSTRFSWFGGLSPRLPRAIEGALDRRTARDFLLTGLQLKLYESFYTQGGAVRSPPSDASALGGTSAHVDRLSAANSGDGAWEEGWEVDAVHDDALVVRKGGLCLHASAARCANPDGVAAPGAQVRLWLSKEYLGMSPGYYMANSNTPFTPDGSANLARLYWNLTAEGAIVFVKHATRLLNARRVPFVLKALNDPAQYTRCDAVVLYLRRADVEGLAPELASLHRRVAPALKGLTPAMTQTLGPGVGFAEDPPRSGSFGLHRCRLLAEGVLRAHRLGATSLTARLEIVGRTFKASGVHLDTPFLSGPSRQACGLRLVTRAPAARGKAGTGRSFDPDRLLDAAAAVGRALCRDAVWFEGRCNWVGLAPGGADPEAQRPARWRYSAMGPALYAGTAGIAWFLAWLSEAIGDRAIRDTARAAMRQALLAADTVAPAWRFGLYTGWVGIALAAARIGSILEDAEMAAGAANLLRRLEHEERDPKECDRLSGRAGGIAGLLALNRMLAEGKLLALAARLGNELLRLACRSGRACSWPSGFKTPRHLTGFSHGTAGIGCALIELAHATGKVSYRNAAHRAFEYERASFDAQAGNWADFREGRSRRPAQMAFATVWCHGAAGIAVSRLRAYELDGDETCKAEADIGLETTRKVVRAMLERDDAPLSLCHGLAGNADILLYGAQVRPGRPEAESLALEVAARTLRADPVRGREWLAGPELGDTPGLMLGRAGLGYFYLRLHQPTTPLVLLLPRGLGES